jgi:hypothetical protein
MMFRRLALMVMVTGLALGLAACANVSGYVSDYYPHWAGGEPHDIPPRPGAPGYDNFISHKGADSDASREAFEQAKAARQANPQGTPQASTAPAAASAPPADNDAVSRGGLY